MNYRKTVQIPIIGKSENEILGEEAGKQRLFELIHSGYSINRSVYDEFSNTVFVTLKRGDQK